MNLLELEGISKRYGGCLALQDVAMAMDAGEMVAILGERRSGRSTLLRIAAGIEAPNAGSVRFADEDLLRSSGLVGGEMAYCRTAFRAAGGATVLDQLMAGQFARRVPRSTASARARRALERVGAERCGNLRVSDLKPDEVVRVAISRALTSQPRLLVFDEPTIGVNVLERDGILTLLRSLADDGIAVLTSTGEGTGVLGADRVLSLSDGKLRGELSPALAPVEDLGRRREARG